MSITAKNLGPIPEVILPDPEGGAIVECCGRNGVGKSTLLDALGSALGDGKIPVKDGEERAELSAFGITIKAARSNRRTGKLDVVSLAGRIDLGKLIDPGYETGDANDERRIKQLVHLAKIAADPSLFYETAGGRAGFFQIASESTIESKDVVQMAERLKKDFETAARKEEAAVLTLSVSERVNREASEAVDLTAESDVVVLQSKFEASVREAQSLETNRAAAIDAERKQSQARVQLEVAEKNYSGLTVEAATVGVKTASDALTKATEIVAAFEKQLAEARRELATADGRYDDAKSKLQGAVNHEAAIRSWRETLDAAVPAKPTEEEIQAARSRVNVARAAIENGAKVRDALTKTQLAKEEAKMVKVHQANADAYREAAKSMVDAVLSRIVNKTAKGLRVEAGRLVVDDHRRGKGTAFDELSPGERTRIAFDIAAVAFPEDEGRPVFVLSQECWTALDPTAKRHAVSLAVERNLLVYTGNATDDEEITPRVLRKASDVR